MPKQKNNLYTPSYFMKRMKDSGFGIWKMFDKYGPHDSRYWTMVIDPGGYTIWVTCYLNREELDDVCFEFNDGGVRIPRNFIIKTSSIETIISNLLGFGIDNTQTFDSCLIDINKYDGKQKSETSQAPEEEITSC